MNALIRYANPLAALSSHFDDLFSDNIFETLDRKLMYGSGRRLTSPNPATDT